MWITRCKWCPCGFVRHILAFSTGCFHCLMPCSSPIWYANRHAFLFDSLGVLLMSHNCLRHAVFIAFFLISFTIISNFTVFLLTVPASCTYCKLMLLNLKTAEAVSQINGTSGDNVAQRGTVWQISCAPGGVGECWWGKHSTSGHSKFCSKSPHCFVLWFVVPQHLNRFPGAPPNLCHCPTRSTLYHWRFFSSWRPNIC